MQVVTDPDRRLVRALLKRHDKIDGLIPRGSPSLIDYCLTSSTIPVIASGGGVNHLYVDRSADLELAARIALDSSSAKPTACNTLELVLAHEDVAEELTRALLRAGAGLAEPWLLRVDPRLAAAVPPGAPVAELAAPTNGREFLERAVGIRPVTGLDEAVAHIRRFGSQHTEGVVAADPASVEAFLAGVDAANAGGERLPAPARRSDDGAGTGAVYRHRPATCPRTRQPVCPADLELGRRRRGQAARRNGGGDMTDRPRVNEAVKRLVVRESRVSVDPGTIDDLEPLNGDLLRVNSLGFLGMLVRLETNSTSRCRTTSSPGGPSRPSPTWSTSSWIW
ncbi:aldehyde dehydrogenase family protein [Salinispora arenicola]|uniref:aldehyde dehydrogenase family protein n=1 Tax=Salinispora arenicola TaxID=168697 RepID=UPI0027DDAEF0|nr:aldehyde dehydrogenase family protein [Salinispora arenicola]